MTPFGPVAIPMKKGPLVPMPPGHDLDYEGVHHFWSDMCCCQDVHLFCVHWRQDNLTITESAR